MNKKNKIVKLTDKVYRLGPLGDPKILSAYLIKDGDRNAIVDCGPEVVADELSELIATFGLENGVDYLLLTHIHIDHAGCAGRFAREHPQCTVYVPRRGYKHMIDPCVLNKSAREVVGDQLMDYWGECSPLPRERTRSVEENEIVSLGTTTEIRYIPARGHAPHHNVLYDDSSRVLFAADSLGILDSESGSHTPTTPPPSFDLKQAMADIDMVSNLGSRLVCLSHFGEVSEHIANFFEESKMVYGRWGRVVRDYLKSTNKKGYDHSDREKIFSELERIDSRYSKLSPALRNQVTRIDISGLASYYLSNLDDANPPALA